MGTGSRHRAGVVGRLVCGALFIALALLALAAPSVLAAPPATPPLPAPIVLPARSVPATPQRNGIGPASVAALTFWVGTTADSSAATDCTTKVNNDCSLRQAVTLANANTGVTNTINFQIASSGVQTITLLSQIDITNPVVIDGYTEPGASPNTTPDVTNGTNAVLTVRVDGGGANINGLVLGGGSDGSTIRGLSVTGFSGVANVGILISNARSMIAGNWIGVAPDGTTHGNYYGVGVVGGGATIGGTSAADRNLISGNNTGTYLQGTSNDVIEGNLIGTNAAGTSAESNSFGGIYINGVATNNTIGGTGAGQANAIAFNPYGVFIGNAPADASVGNTIRGNSIHDNTVGGIVLNGQGANDHCDADSGPNNFQNFPVLTAAIPAGNTVQVSGTLDSTGGRTFHIDFYASPTNAGQGQTSLGSTDVTAAASPTCTTSFASFAVPLVVNQPWITATATDTTTGDTSQFSAPVTAVIACTVNSTMDPTDPTPGKLTLRDAVGALNDGECTGDKITFDPAVFPVGGAQKITLDRASGTLTLSFTARPVTIDGTGAGVVVDGGYIGGNTGVRVFTVNSGVTATLTALTVQHGNTGNNGGGIDNNGALTVTNSTVAGNNTASAGGGIDNNGTLMVTNSTFVGNSAGGLGGGISNGDHRSLTATNSTFVGNSAGNGGGGIFTGGGATLTNTLVANSTGGGDLSTYSVSGGAFTGTNNLIDDGTINQLSGSNNISSPALLGPLGNYGGPTQTIPLLPGSPAIDAGTTGGSVPSSDQRGKPRVGSAPDIGSFESQGFTLTPVAGSTPQSAVVGQPFTNPLAVTVTANNPVEPVQGGIVTFTPPATGASATLATSPATITSDRTARVTATANGTPGMNYPVTASTTGATSATFTLTNFAPPITLTPTTLPNGTAEQPYGPVTLVASGGTAPYTFTVTTGTLPNGLTLSTTGVLSGTPTQAGSFSFTVTATDASTNHFTGSQTYTLTITAPSGITLAPTSLPNGAKGVAYPSQTFTAAGGVAPYTFSVTTGSLPPGLTLSSAGVLNGTPTATGTFSFTVTARDANGFTGSQAYTITITAAPLIGIAITCAGSTTPSIKVGQMVTCIATGTYADGSMQPLPAGQVTWSGNNGQVATVDPATGKVTGESPGTIHLTATDGNVTQTITVTVGAPTPIGITVPPAPASRPSGASAAGGAPPAPLPNVPSRGGGGGSGSAPAALPPGR